MAEPAGQRQLLAIMFTDVVGYTALTERDEAAAVHVRDRHRKQVREQVTGHGGEVVDSPGDEILSVFASALAAVDCALALQAALRDDPELRLRIGIHLGDVLRRGGEVIGEGVNVAARIRPLAQPGGIYISEPVWQMVRSRSHLRALPRGSVALKNVGAPVTVYALSGASAGEGLKPKHRRGGSTIRRAAIAVAVAIAAAAALTLARSWLPSSPAVPASVVVLPFADMSEGRDQEYFADGMTEEIINALARLPDLRVVARTSAFAFKGKDADVRAVGEQLGVRHVVEGSVRRSGERLRVTAQLVSVADGYHVWSETYERPLADVFAIQEDVATRVAEALSVRIGGRSLAPRPAKNLRAYELYLTGRQLWSLRTEESMRRSIEYFEQVLALEPSYAPALSGSADAMFLLYSYGFDDDVTLVERARKAAEAAVEADPSLGAAHASLGFLQLGAGTWNWKQAEAHLLRAIELDPGYATAHHWQANVLMAQARLTETRSPTQRALELDPLSPIIVHQAGHFAMLAGDPDRAIELLRRAVDLNPHSTNARLGLAHAYASTGREREAAETVLAAAPPPARPTLQEAFEAGGLRVLFERWLRSEQERTGRPCPPRPGLASILYTYIGDTDGVFRCLQESARRGEKYAFAQLDPVFAPYRSDPRYAAYLESINLSE